jgi:hypothetical protein
MAKWKFVGMVKQKVYFHTMCEMGKITVQNAPNIQKLPSAKEILSTNKCIMVFSAYTTYFRVYICMYQQRIKQQKKCGKYTEILVHRCLSTQSEYYASIHQFQFTAVQHTL